MLIQASRTLSRVGLTSEPGGALIFLPRQRPATIRTSSRGKGEAGRGKREVGSGKRALGSCFGCSNIGYSCLEVALSAVVVALEPEGDVDLRARLKFSSASGQTPSNRVECSRAGV